MRTKELRFHGNCPDGSVLIPRASGVDFTLQDSFKSKKAVWEGAALGEAAVKRQQESKGAKGTRTGILKEIKFKKTQTQKNPPNLLSLC